MSKFGIVPPEPIASASLDGLAPLFRAAVVEVLYVMKQRGHLPVVREAVRTNERQRWLYGMGRTYDDGRGIVTNAASALTSWHWYGLAVDIVDAVREDAAPPQFWRDLYECAHLPHVGCISGLDWKRRAGALGDRPHVQWGNGMRFTPSAHAVALAAAGGNRLVWKAVGAGA